MNKFFAILKDSFRESRSTWVLQAMLVLCVLLLVFVGSVSFKLVSLETALSNTFSTLNWASKRTAGSGNPQYVIENYTASKPDSPWIADYNFDLVIATNSPEDLALAKKSGLPTDRSSIRTLLKEKLFFLDNLKIVQAPAAEKAKEIRYQVSTTGTKTPDRLSWQHEPSIFFGLEMPMLTESLREGVYTLEKRLVNDIGAWITLFVSIIITAGYIPNMLGKGVLDLYVSKPITRPQLLIFKYIGGLTFVFILTTAIVGGMWLIIGLRNGIWTPQILAMIPIVTFYFAILYSVSVLVAVLTRSSLLAILATVIVWALAFGAGYLHDKVQQAERQTEKMKEKLRELQPGSDDELPPEVSRATNFADWVKVVANVGHTILPRTYDLDDRMIRLIADGILTPAEIKNKNLDEPIPSYTATFGASFAFIAVMLGLACWRFSSRDG